MAGRKGTSKLLRRRYPQSACSDLGPLFAFVLMVSRPLAKPFCRAGASYDALFASRPSNILDEKLLLVLVFFVHGCLRHSKLLRTVNIRVLLVYIRIPETVLIHCETFKPFAICWFSAAITPNEICLASDNSTQ